MNVQYLTLKKRSGSRDVTWRRKCIMNWAGDVMRRGQGLAIWWHRWGKLNQKRSRTFRLLETIFLWYIFSTERPSVYIFSLIGDNPRPTFDIGSLKSFYYLPCMCVTQQKKLSIRHPCCASYVRPRRHTWSILLTGQSNAPPESVNIRIFDTPMRNRSAIT